ncbi:hypothetical protein [Candidatus Electronema sp. JM]|uniref:hypothetical protein n=1 Tax=Candidatus Electronema sp. JM TaxID=3401571 RepID=UPI003AA7ED3A
MYHYEVISDEYQFEEFIQALFNAKYSTQSFQLYGSKGTSQHGIDIFSTEKRIVIQCKKKDISRSDKTLREELIKDIESCLRELKQLQFSFNIFILATTTKRYTSVQDHAANLSENSPFEVQFLSWKDIERLIHQFPEVRKQYYPHLAVAESSSGNNRSILQEIKDSSIYAPVTQVAGDFYLKTDKSPKINILPPPTSIGGNPLLKKSIIDRFNKIGEEREKRFGKSAYGGMYGKFKRDFGIKKEEQWTRIWLWPAACAVQIIKYLDEKYSNTIAGRIEKAATKEGCIPKRPFLFKKEGELLSQLQVDRGYAKDCLHKYFGVTSRKNLTDSQFWQWISYLEEEVKRVYGEDY